MMWLFASGMPKVGKISRFIDKAARGVPHGGPDATSPAHGKYKTGCSDANRSGRGFGAGAGQFMKEQAAGTAERPVVQDAEVWTGHSPALRPSWEPILVGMKPLDGNYAENAIAHGVAGFNVDEARIQYQSNDDKESATPQGRCTSKEISAIGATPDAGRNMERVEFKTT